MIETILPRHFDNTFHGNRLAVWLFALVVLVKAAQGASVLVDGDTVIVGADGIPLDTYPAAAARTIVSVWALLGLARLMICLLGVLVLIRYRSMLPLMFGFLALQDAGRYVVLQLLPLTRVGSPPGAVIYAVLFGLVLIGLVLSLRPRRDGLAQPA